MVTATATLANEDLAIGGAFSRIDKIQASGIAIRRGGSWRPLGTGLASPASGNVWVWSLLANPQGDLLVGGQFETAGGVAAAGLARWDGSAWSAVGGGLGTAAAFGPAVTAMMHLPNGDLVVAGAFTSAGGVSVNNIARFDGAVWSSLGGGLQNAPRALLVLSDGDLVAAGPRLRTSGSALARWD